MDTMDGRKMIPRFTVREVSPAGGALLERPIKLAEHRMLGRQTATLGDQLQGLVLRIRVDGGLNVVGIEGMEPLLVRLLGSKDDPRAGKLRDALTNQAQFWLMDLLHVVPNRTVQAGETWRQRVEFPLGDL